MNTDTLPNSRPHSTDQIGVTHTIRISCDCSTCMDNAKYLGKTGPLAAWIMPSAAEKMKITAKNCNRPTKSHGVVYMAHMPVLGAAQRMALPE